MDPPYVHHFRSHDHLPTLEEDTTGQIPGRLRNETNSGSKEVIRSTRKLQKSSFCGVVIEFLKKNGQIIICMIALLADALPLYMLGVMKSRVCLKFNKIVAVVAVVLLTVFDLFYIYTLKLRCDLQKSGRRHLLRYSVYLVLPAPQIIASIMIKWRGERNVLTWTLLYFFLLLKHLLKSIPVVIWSKKALTSGNLADCSLMFIFYYVYPSQLYGALWYLLATYRQFQCWNEACKKHLTATQDQCTYYIFTGHYNSSHDAHIIEKSCDEDKYRYGMVDEALKSGLLSMTVSPWNKMLYCFRQGLQHLSSFGQNLQAGMDIAGNLYAIGVFIFGMISFSLLIGVIQIIQQSSTKRFVTTEKKLKEIEQWMPFQDLSANLQSQIKNYKQENWQETKFVNLENMLHNLSEELRRQLTRELCLDKLKKVKEFRKWSVASLEDLCDCVKPVTFVERTRIIREGDLIDEMVFVVRGVTWTYPSTRRISVSPSNGRCNRKIDHLKGGDFCGRELINWVRYDPYSFDFPISTTTTQAVTKVEAFVLMAYDLKNTFIKHGVILFLQFRWRFIRHWRSRRISQTTAPDFSMV